MELIIFIGIPASGKSTFYKNNFFNSHVRISLDLFKTRFKEWQYFSLGLNLQQKMVIDNTNVAAVERKRYIEPAKIKKYNIIGYYFEANIRDCLARNEKRREKINKIGILAKNKELQLPHLQEGFDKIYKVKLEKDNSYSFMEFTDKN